MVERTNEECKDMMEAEVRRGSDPKLSGRDISDSPVLVIDGGVRMLSVLGEEVLREAGHA